MLQLRLDQDELSVILRALGSELLFVEWQLKRTIADGRAPSAAELSVSRSELERVIEKLHDKFESVPRKQVGAAHRHARIRSAAS
ncbi:MAG: hypothetical protein KGL39_22405 [Patescibacteria group bacterium]|nr:hypothetical protein [Patescibacteria group bacterium]